MRVFIGLLLVSVMLLVACSKAPEHVINEDDMAGLMVDIYKAEAMIEDESEAYNNDSLKMMVRQSVFEKHNVTQAKYDTSLIWYAHNLEVYNKVYDDIIARLDDEYKELSKGDFTSVSVELSSDVKPSVPRYRNVGDTADIWEESRTWIMLPGFVDNIVSFDVKPDRENMQGDRYELAFKVTNVRNAMKIYLGVEYKNGATAYIQRTINNDGWKSYKLQSDSAQDVRRIYGFMSYKSKSKHVVYVDSVELLRTHLDRNSYLSVMRQHKTIGQKDKEEKSKENDKNSQKKKDLNNSKGKKIEPEQESDKQLIKPIRVNSKNIEKDKIKRKT